MPPWTTRTLQAAVVAAGVTAVGSGFVPAADAAPVPDKPDLTRIPDQIELNAPLDGCDPAKAPSPCFDGGAHVAVPTMVKQVGGHVVRTGGGLTNAARSGSVPQAVGVVYAESLHLQQTAKARPTVGVAAKPDHVAGLGRQSEEGGLLDTEIGPRGRTHEGVSAVDTALELSFARGYAQEPPRPVGEVVAPVVRDAPVVDRLLDRPQPRDSESFRRTPAMASLDSTVHDAVTGTTHNVATGMPQAPVDVLGTVSGGQ